MEGMAMGSAKAPTPKIPELLGNIQEVSKAVEVVRQTTEAICGLLRVGLNEPIGKAQEQNPSPPLIAERCAFLSELRSNLYGTNERLQLILNALQEV